MLDPIIAGLIGTLISAIASVSIAIIQARFSKSQSTDKPNGFVLPEGVKFVPANRSRKTIFWVVAFTLAGGFAGYFIGSIFSQPARSITAPDKRELIEKIAFDYSDSPEQHGWVILDQPPPIFRHISSGFVGNALEITSYDGRAMDFDVGPAARFGTLIEFAVKLEEKAIVYAYVEVQSKNKSTSRDVWFAFLPGTKQPERIYEGQEWTVYVTPEQLGGEWLLLRIDLKETVMNTIGAEGWSLGQLMKFRLRGNLSVACISIYE